MLYVKMLVYYKNNTSESCSPCSNVENFPLQYQSRPSLSRNKPRVETIPDMKI